MLKLAFIVVCGVAICTAFSTKVDPSLNKALKATGTANIFVSFNAGTQSVLDSFIQQNFETRADRLKALSAVLQEHALQTQRNVLDLLRHSGFESTSFSINNQVNCGIVVATVDTGALVEHQDLKDNFVGEYG